MDLSQYRADIDRIDDQLLRLFVERMEVAAGIAAYKRENGLPVLDERREREKLLRIAEKTPEELRDYAVSLYSLIFELSRSSQNRLLDRKGELAQQISAALEETPKVFPADATVACQCVEGSYQQPAMGSSR